MNKHLQLLSLLAALCTFFSNSNAENRIDQLTNSEDASKQFTNFFQIQSNAVISYKITTVNSPNLAMADQLQKSIRPATSGTDGMNNKAMTEFVNRMRNGYTSSSFKNIYVSTGSNAVLETRCNDEWNKGIINNQYFKDGKSYQNENNKIRVEPLGQSINPVILVQFPQLFAPLGFSINQNTAEENETGFVFHIRLNNYPLSTSYTTDKNCRLITSEMRDWEDHFILFSKFSYSADSNSWPSHIYTESYSQNGSLAYAVTYELIGIKDLPKDFSFAKGSEEGRIGAVISLKDGKPIISYVFKNSGALYAGVKENDMILEVDGKNVSSMKFDDVFQMLKGNPNTTVKITIIRDGQNKLEFNVIRHEMDTTAMMMEEQEQRQAKQSENLGKTLPIEFTALDGKEVDLSAMKGKVVLLDFWATWCGPCVGEIPHVKEAYKKFHDHGFEVVGISFDQDKSKLEQFIKENGMPWPQYFDGKGWQNQFGEKYDIKSIPTMWLIGKDGNLADINGRNGLSDKVQKLLESK